MELAPDDRPARSLRSREVAWLTAIVFVGTAVLFHRGYARFPVLYDFDAYYHLAVARAYATRGMLHTLDWARFSILHDGFGDKELLFHLFLVPFVRLGDPTAGGFLALTLIDALVAAVLAHAAVSAIGRWGAAIPFLCFGTAIDFALRMVRLRPELVSLLLILAAITLAARRRAVLLAAVAGVYALSYTAFQALLGLCLLFWAYGFWVERRNDWRLVVYPAVAVALALVAHPQFPANLRVWVAQNVDFFVHQASVDVGAEIQSRTTRDTLVLNVGWIVGLLVLWRSRQTVAAPAAETRLRDFTLLAATAFTVLYLLMARFIIYAVPLVTLAVVRAMAAAGQRPGPATRLPWRGQIPFPLAMGLCLLAAVPATRLGFRRMEASAARVFHPGMRADWEAFARAMPEGANVVAPWAATEHFVFWAPQGRYLNLLDPVFMLRKDPALHRLATEVFEGREPDVPLVARARLDSDHYADDGQYPFAHARLVADPRVTPLHEGVTYLYRFDADQNADFLLDWKILPPATTLPPALDVLGDPALRGYPRGTGRERAFEGYVDGRRLGDVAGCVAFGRIEEVARPTRVTLEVSPYGTAEVFVDDRLAASILSPRAAVLGRGVVVPLDFDPGRHRLAIRTCPVEDQLGFYALVRQRRSGGS